MFEALLLWATLSSKEDEDQTSNEVQEIDEEEV